MKRKPIECIRAAHEELIRLGMLIDKNKPLHGRTMWAPNPRFTAEAQLTAEQRKALIESDSTGSDLQEKRQHRQQDRPEREGDESLVPGLCGQIQ